MSKSFCYGSIGLALQASFSWLERTRFLSFIIIHLTPLSSLIKHGCMFVCWKCGWAHTHKHAASHSRVSLLCLLNHSNIKKEQRTLKPPSWIRFQGGLTLSCEKPSRTEGMRGDERSICPGQTPSGDECGLRSSCAKWMPGPGDTSACWWSVRSCKQWTSFLLMTHSYAK